MLAHRSEDPVTLRARLYLQAVLGAMPLLPEVDPFAERLVTTGRPGACLLSVKNGPGAGLLFDGEAIHRVEADHPHPECRLGFRDCAGLNRFFEGSLTLPVVHGLFRRPGLPLRLAGLLLRLKAVMEPGPTATLSSRQAQAYLLLNFAVVTQAVPFLAETLPAVRDHLAAGPAGLLVLTVDEHRCPQPLGLRFWVQVLEDGRAAAGLVVPSRPANAEVRFANPATAVRNLRQEEIPQAAVNRGGIRVAGSTPLADSVNAVFAWLARLLPAR
ncbi:MAG: hypothetical protein ACFE0O_06100 [Opitutales bacterium]